MKIYKICGKDQNVFWITKDGQIINAPVGHDVAVFKNPEIFGLSHNDLEYDVTNDYKKLAMGKGNVAIRLMAHLESFRQNEMAIFGQMKAIRKLWDKIYDFAKKNKVKSYIVRADEQYSPYMGEEEFIERYGEKVSRIYKLAFRNTMDVHSNKIAKFIMSSIRKWHKSGKFKEPNKLVINPKILNFQKPIKTQLNIEVVDEVINPPFFINATYAYIESLYKLPEKHEITINMTISTLFNEQHYNEMYMSIVNIIRHEIEHYFDAINNNDVNKYNKTLDYDIKLLNKHNKTIQEHWESITKYMFSQLEKVPFIRGIMMSSKKTGTSFKENISKHIHDQLFTASPKVEYAIKMTVGEHQAEHVEQLLVDLYLKKAELIFQNIK